MNNLQVLITRLDPDLPLPTYAKGGDAGAGWTRRGRAYVWERNLEPNFKEGPEVG